VRKKRELLNPIIESEAIFTDLHTYFLRKIVLHF
jgi:hypothetical protein